MPFTTGDNNFATAKWIVSPTAGQGTHTTIAAALTSASSGDIIAIKQGTYTENLTLKAGVSLVGWSPANVTIIGKMTATTAGVFWIQNITFQTNGDFILDVSGSAATVPIFFNCNLNGTNASIISFSSSSASAVMGFRDCQFNLATTGIATFISTSPGSMRFGSCILNNTGLSTTASTISAGSFVLYFCEVYHTITTSGTAGLDIRHTILSTVNINFIALTHGSSGTSAVSFTDFITGTATAFTITSTLTCSSISVNSSNASTITGAGTINYNPINFVGTAVMTVTTQTPLSMGPGGFRGLQTGTPGAGFKGEQIRSAIASGSAVSLTTATAANITSISLTAGIWDVSGVVMFKGLVTGTATGASIGTVSATTGTQGDNYVTSPTVPTAIDYGITIPSYRISLAATTTVYLVGLEIFTVGTATAYGRISATRVG